MKTVGIIGGSGFIGSYITQKFLREGFRVRVSTTDISKSEKYTHLKALINAKNLEILPLRVENKEQLQAFVRGCDIVVHGGTPFQLDVKDPKTELFDPTIKGTENFLQVVSQTPNIDKVVFIASVAAYNSDFPMPPGNKALGDTFDESDVPFMSEESHPYGQAKFIANQTVERFLKDYPNLGFEVTSVAPVAVMGKALSARQDSTSGGLQFLFKNKLAPNPFIQMLYDHDVAFALVDVKDVAEAIYAAGIRTGLHGKNYLLSSESWKVSDISAMLNGNTPAGEASIVYKNDAARRDLGISFSPAVVPLTNFGK